MKMRARNLIESRREILEIESEGYDVIYHSDVHWKLNGIDVWPSTRKYMKPGEGVKHFESLRELL